MYYVYLHRKATDGEVFYVGKGKNLRASSYKSRSTFWKSVVAKYGYYIEIVETGLQEWYAFELEKDLISYYGRCDLEDIHKTSVKELISGKCKYTKDGWCLSENKHLKPKYKQQFT